MDIKHIIKKQIENGLIHPNDGATKEGFEMGYKYAKSEQLLIHSVVVPKGTLCDVCGCENTITISHKGENCDYCNPL